MPNRLIHENSPYLLQHAENPVDWYPWGEEALQKARRENKPIFLSIGYAACHWCHVMAHESFEDPQIAEIMNRHFVNIKVDREERPDLDGIYMSAVVAMTGQGGWPMSVFLAPDGTPFYGGTYFPPTRRYNLPSFREVLEAIARAWQENPTGLWKSGEEIRQRLRAASQAGVAGRQEMQPASLEQAAMALAQSYDWTHGGWGGAPKFPQPMAIEFLLRRAAGGPGRPADKFALEIAAHALRAMAKGGMYDVVGGGFARYSTDRQWLVPHFEKMLYDNAQLARAYLHGFLLIGDEHFRQVCEETLDFVRREMTHPQGGFYSSLDADSEGEEGKFYLWSFEQIREALPAEDLDFFLAAYHVTPQGNFEGRNILQRALDDADLAERFGAPESQVRQRLQRLHGLLLQARDKRVRPGADDKVLVSWNARMLATFAEAARALRRSDYLETARRNASFLLSALHPQDRLLRAWREGSAGETGRALARHNAYLEDYAALVLGLLELYQSDPDPRWYEAAVNLAEEMLAHYRDPQGGFFDTRDDHEELLVRPKDLQDNATPCGNSLAALALLELSAYTGRSEIRDLAEAMLGAIQAVAVRYPTAFAQWLSALDFALGPVQEVVIVGEPDDPQTAALVEALWSAYRPRAIAAISAWPPPENSPPLLHDRPLLAGQPTAYVCQNFMCRRPVTAPDELKDQLEGTE